MKKDIRDYLHLYLGCEVVTPDGIGWLASVSRDRRKMDGLMLSNVVAVDFRKIILTKNSVDGCDKKRNHGHYLISSENYFSLDAPEGTEPEFSMIGGIKLLLRTLSSMTEEEITELFLLKGMTKPDKVTRTEIKDRFLQIEYIHSGVYGSDYQHIITMYPDQFAYLLSKSFDLFGLIDAGLALDITKQPGQHNEQYR